MNWSLDLINALFGGHGRTAILRLLAGQTSPLTGREVAELTGLSQAGAALALRHLAELGVVVQHRVGRAITNELQRDSVLVQSIVLPALDAERTLADDLRRMLADTFGDLAVSVVLFGSLATREAAPGSDIDVLVVTANQEDATRASDVADESGPRFFRRYGMPLSVIVQSRETLPAKPTAFLASARDTGELVSGVPLKDLMRDASR
jgi:predicted nucleotidyltransferase